MRSIRKIVVLGANGAMGSGSGAMFAAAGLPVVFLARTVAKAEDGKARADKLTRGTIADGLITCGSYADDLAAAVRDADLVLEAVSEDPAIKRAIYARIDAHRGAATIVATVSSGLSIAELCSAQSVGFKRHFLGIHLFNPPTVIVGCELIAHRGADATDPGVIAVVREFLAGAVAREVVETADTPAFAGNRLGFKLLNEVAQLAEEHGVAYMDQLVGTHTGRALAPLATIDLVGWDVHKAIVDNLWARTRDVAHERFSLPAYMQRGIDRGHLGRKTRDRGGFFRVEKLDGGGTRTFVLDPRSGDYALADSPPTAVTTQMRAAIAAAVAAGAPADRAAMDALCAATGKDAELLRQVLLGYVSYGLGLVGSVVERPRDIDRIMGFGFVWAPPGMLVDAIGAARTITLLERAKLPVPAAIADAATHQRPLFAEPGLPPTRFFAAT